VRKRIRSTFAVAQRPSSGRRSRRGRDELTRGNAEAYDGAVVLFHFLKEPESREEYEGRIKHSAASLKSRLYR
jgi:hypothetical protein